MGQVKFSFIFCSAKNIVIKPNSVSWVNLVTWRPHALLKMHYDIGFSSNYFRHWLDQTEMNRLVDMSPTNFAKCSRVNFKELKKITNWNNIVLDKIIDLN